MRPGLSDSSEHAQWTRTGCSIYDRAVTLRAVGTLLLQA